MALTRVARRLCRFIAARSRADTCHSIKSGLAATQSRVWAEIGHTVDPLRTLRMPPVQFAGLYR